MVVLWLYLSIRSSLIIYVGPTTVVTTKIRLWSDLLICTILMEFIKFKFILLMLVMAYEVDFVLYDCACDARLTLCKKGFDFLIYELLQLTTLLQLFSLVFVLPMYIV